MHHFWRKLSDTHDPDNDLGPLLMAVIIALIVTLVATAIGTT